MNLKNENAKNEEDELIKLNEEFCQKVDKIKEEYTSKLNELSDKLEDEDSWEEYNFDDEEVDIYFDKIFIDKKKSMINKCFYPNKIG